MAKKKPARKSSPKPVSNKASKKNSVAMKSTPASSSKSSGAAKKGKDGKASSKPKRQGRALVKKAAVSQKKTSAKTPSTPKSIVSKNKRSVSNKKAGSTKMNKVVAKAPSRSALPSSPSAESKMRVESLSPTERYNLGGLFVCAIQRTNDPDFKRLRAMLRHLELPSHEKDNLLRLSQGFTIPKLFADGIEGRKVSQTLMDLIKFASAEGAYEKKWQNEIRQVGLWLGFFPQQVEQIEQTVLAKR
jgi:hypothetical protein